MDPAFDAIMQQPENDIFSVVFYPDRIYHAQYLNATRSENYEYNVHEVRSSADITVLKGQIRYRGVHLSNFIRIEYRASRLVEQSRQNNRLAQEVIDGWMQLEDSAGNKAEASIRLHLCRWTDSWQAEFWQTLDAPANAAHDLPILDQMGYRMPITCIEAFTAMLERPKEIRRVAMAFRETDRSLFDGLPITDPKWDNNYLRSHQESRTTTPSSPLNTVADLNYFVDFRRGYFLDATQVPPVFYRNAMMDPDNPDRDDTGGPADNVIAMRWILQRELGAQLVFFHEVEIPAGKVEGTHQHIGSEELYYILSGEGTAYMGAEDVPELAGTPTVQRHIYGVGVEECVELPVRAGHVIFTKSGGIHGIRAGAGGPIKFVAFLYHSS